MPNDPGALSNLRDLALPDPVAWWPPAAGVWILAATMLGLAAAALARAAACHRADAYRRAAARRLHAIDAALAGGTTARRDVGLAVFALLKRTALAAYPREEVASLSGPAFVDFLIRTSARRLDTAALAHDAAQAYGRTPADEAASHKLIVQARVWVASHRAPGDGGG
jgi:hypothetical protein